MGEEGVGVSWKGPQRPSEQLSLSYRPPPPTTPGPCKNGAGILKEILKTPESSRSEQLYCQPDGVKGRETAQQLLKHFISLPSEQAVGRQGDR